MTQINDALINLNQVLDDIGALAVAVSGGVDSMTLAHAAHLHLGMQATMYHAMSPAVPPEASTRVQQQADIEGWRLKIIDAGEFDDQDYRANPVNRCYFCKNNLYDRIVGHVNQQTIVSGTNMDDLGDYRPGLQAAEQHGVRHPFVEAGIDKAGIRALARHFGLDDIAELPAAPCLSSRIETGIPIQATDLRFVHRIERLLQESLKPQTVRCRVRKQGVAIELDTDSLALLESAEQETLRQQIESVCQEQGYTDMPLLTPYQRGSAFLREQP